MSKSRLRKRRLLCCTAAIEPDRKVEMRRALVCVPVALLIAASGCKAIALNAVADALSSGGSVFASDNDPVLVRDAAPFGLKTYESILAELPDHRGLLL